jgi:60 kDa SS-A/Ro ribonucleoprotein
MSCLLWENTFYEDGELITNRIARLIPQIDESKLVELVRDAKYKSKLRHIPLFLIREMARHEKYRKYISILLAEIIQRPDELCEFLALYWKNERCPIAAQVKKGLAKAFTKFNEYSLAKYNRDNAIKLRDVLFMVHAKPLSEAQEALWKRLINNELQIPDTWEVVLSAGKDKKQTFERLMYENKLGGLAFLRNLRNMIESRVDESLIKNYLAILNVNKILPFRFIAAAKYVPQFELEIETKMLSVLDSHQRLFGKTVLLVDVSGSMDNKLSEKSELTRLDAACGLAIFLRECCENIAIVTFSNQSMPIPSRRGFALRDAIVNSQSHQGTYLGQAVSNVREKIPHDRLIVITDEQSHDDIPSCLNISAENYMINIGCNKNGIRTDKDWLHIDGWSEAVIDYILELETINNERETILTDRRS